MSIPKKYRGHGLYEKCNVKDCRKEWQDPNGVKCKIKNVGVSYCPFKENHCYITKAYNPITKKSDKVKSHGKVDIETAWEESVQFKKDYKAAGYDMEVKREVVKPNLLHQWIALYIDQVLEGNTKKHKKKKLSKGYIRDNIRYLLNFKDCMNHTRKFNRIMIEALNENHVADFDNWLNNQVNRKGEPISDRTYNANMDAVQYCIGWIKKTGKYDFDNPFEDVTREIIQTDPRSFTDEEIDILIKSLSDEDNHKFQKGKTKSYMTNYYLKGYVEFVRAALIMGCRLAELLNIKCSHIDEKRSIISVPHSEKASKKYDYVPITLDLAETLASMNYEPGSDEYLFFPHRTNRETLRTFISTGFSKICTKAGMEWGTFHKLRSSHITRCIVKWGDIPDKNSKEIAIKHYYDKVQQAEKFKGERMFFEEEA